MEQEPLFQPISEAEYEAAHTQSISPRRNRGRALVLEPRTRNTWYNLDHHMGFCTIEAHEEIQRMLNPGQLSYREKYPTRMLVTLPDGREMCKDCFYNEGDKE